MKAVFERHPRLAAFTIAAALFAAGIFAASAFSVEYDSLSLRVVFPVNPAAPSEPLVTAGVFEAADFLMVQYPSPATIRFRYDVWGQDGAPFPEIRVTRDVPHVLDIRMPALYTPRNVLRPSNEPRNELVIVLDGREVVRSIVKGNTVRPDQIYIGSNPVHGSTCSESFSGRIERANGTQRRGSLTAVLSGHSRAVAFYLCLCLLAGCGLVIAMAGSASRTDVIRSLRSSGIAVAACALALVMLTDLAAGFSADWFIHTWFVAYHGVFSQHHLRMPEVIHTQQAAGMIDPAFYGHLPYSAIGFVSSAIGPDIPVRMAFFLALLFQFLEVRKLFRMVAAGELLANTAATLTTWTVYPLTNLFQRSSVLEFTAGCLLTVAVCRMLRWPIERDPVAFWRSVLAFCICLSVTMLLHPITALLGCTLCAVLWLALVIASERRARLLGAAIVAAVSAFTVAGPWLYMIARFQRSLRISSPNPGLQFYPFDQLWVRLYPFAFDPRTTPETLRTVSTPYLDAQINLPMLVLVVLLLSSILLRRSFSPPSSLRRLCVAAFFAGAIAFAVALAVSVSPALASYVIPPFNMTQFAVRLVNYCNLGLLLLLTALAVARPLPKRLVSIACVAALALSFAGLCTKYPHIASAISHRSAWTSESEILNLPGWFYGLGDFSVTRDLALPDPGIPLVKQAFAVAGGDRFGEIESDLRFTTPTESTVSTNVVAFPWNRLILDGVPQEISRLLHDGLYYAVRTSPGDHVLRYEFQPDAAWRRLGTFSSVTLTALILALCFFRRRT